MQSVLHPDKFSTRFVFLFFQVLAFSFFFVCCRRSDEEKEISESYSSLVNKAFGVLQSPVKRALHLLAIKGEKISEEQKLDEPEFLLEIMELNEEVEAANTDEELVELNKKNKAQLEGLVQEVSNCFKNNDVRRAKEVIIKMKYYWSVGEHINRLLRERGVTD